MTHPQVVAVVVVTSKLHRIKDYNAVDLTGDEIHIARDDAFVVASIVLFTSLGRKTCAVAAVMDEEEIARLGGSDKIGKNASYVLASGLSVGVVSVDQDGDVIL